MNKLHILLLGGGTGGHIYPLVSVAQEIRRIIAGKNKGELDPVRSLARAEGASPKDLGEATSNGVDLRYFGDPGEYRDYLTKNGIVISQIASSKLRRYASLLNFLDGFKFIWGFIQALFKLYFFMPEVAFSKAGPGVLPIVYAARWYRIPLVVHESDTIPGLTSRLSAKHAAVVELAFENAKNYFTKNKTVRVVGLPVRQSVISSQSPAACRQALGLPDGKPIVFFVGGSQGAQAINDFVLANLELLLNDFEVVHQVGAANYDQYKREFEFMTKHFRPGLTENYVFMPYLSDEQMAAALGAADVVLSRAGSSIFELAANGKASIVVPINGSANGHQAANAYAYAQAGAGVVIEEENLLPGLVMTQLQKMIQNKEWADKMRTSAKAFYKPDAAASIAGDVLATAGVRP